MEKSESHKPKPVKIEVPPSEMGTVTWTLPDDLSKEFRRLPFEIQDQLEKLTKQRMYHMVLLIFGLMKHPELEHRLGGRLDAAFIELGDHLSGLLEKPPKPQ